MAIMRAAAVAAAVMMGLAGCTFDKRGLPGGGADAGPEACGDGVIQSGEACDDQNQQNGDGCDSSCQVEAGWQCAEEPSVCVYLCGNGTLDPGEECEGADLNGASCATVPGGFTGGTLACGGSCQFNTTGCILPGCGNGEVGPGEDCDDGNSSNEDDCLNNCQSAGCGDGFVWAGQEDCDDGNGLDTDDCLTSCTLPSCGDGFVWAGHEACDDGNTSDTDGCVGSCEIATCGDGFVWAGQEDCDDGNTSDTDDCLNNCSAASCGDSVIWSGHEDCDDGNTSDNDDCLNDCTAASCGDGIIWNGNEDCDDGNAGNGDGCSSVCAVEDHFACDGEPSDCTCVVYVNQASIATNANGASWSNAYSSFRTGINHASTLTTGTGDYCDVWAAAGTYTAGNAHTLPSRVIVYGGFAGGETAVHQRNISANVTVLDGLGTADSVISGANITESGLNGLVVRNGAGSGYGGGVWLQGQDLTLANCLFEDNYAGNHGGGVYITTDSTVTISRCVFRNNTADDNAAGLAVRYGAAVVVADSLFYDNVASGDGGAFWVEGSPEATLSLTLINCTVADNVGANGIGAVRNDGGSLTAVNSILWNNGPSAISANGGTITITYSNIQGGYPGTGNSMASPLFANPGTHNYQLQSGSPCIDSADGGPASARDLLGFSRVDAPPANSGTGTPAFVDRGAYEYLQQTVASGGIGDGAGSGRAGAGRPGAGASPRGCTTTASRRSSAPGGKPRSKRTSPR